MAGCQPQPLDEILRQHQHDGAGVDNAFDARTADTGFRDQAAIGIGPIDGVLHLALDDNLSHATAYLLNDADDEGALCAESSCEQSGAVGRGGFAGLAPRPLGPSP